MRCCCGAIPACVAPVAAAVLLQGELDELEREEFFRLKKVQKNKQKVAARDAADKAAQVRASMLLLKGRLCYCYTLYGDHAMDTRRSSATLPDA